MKKRQALTAGSLLNKNADGLVDYLKLTKVLLDYGKEMTIDEFNELQKPHVEWNTENSLFALITVYNTPKDYYIILKPLSEEYNSISVLSVTNVHSKHFNHKNSKNFSEGNSGTKIYFTIEDKVTLFFGMLDIHGAISTDIYVDDTKK